MIKYLILSIAIIINITIHEFTKAFTSYKLGDNTPKNEGKLTLNPLAHLEPIGFLMFLFIDYGWGKPTNTSSLNYKNRKKGVILTYSLPIIVNLIFGFIALKLYTFFPKIGNIDTLFWFIFSNSIDMAIFNLFPIYPLCGYKLLTSILEPNKAFIYSQYQNLIQILTIILLFSGFLSYPLNIISNFIRDIFILMA